ncbi:MAG: hypothetical protein MUC44_08920 [Beijerinckiaceae bacterium]|jgi:hypothetical protein|nr:hypothetical protein [Beijerinckiaceae bacterium]
MKDKFHQAYAKFAGFIASVPLGPLLAFSGGGALIFLGSKAWHALGLSTPAAWGLAAFLVFVQAKLWQGIRNRSQPLYAIVALFTILTSGNILTTGAGLVAAFPDLQGASMLEEQLAPAQLALESRSSALRRAAAALRRAGDSSRSAAAIESAPSVATGYRATCPASTGPGSGPITRWRIEAADIANAAAAELDAAADAATNATQTSRTALAGYKAASHGQIVGQLSASVLAVNVALAGIDGAGITATLKRLQADTGSGGLCLDATMNVGLARALALVTELDLTAVPFTRPPPPSEDVAIVDLFEQHRKLAQREPNNVGLYYPAVLIAPLVDILFIVGLGMMAGQRPRSPEPDVDPGGDLALGLGLEKADAALATAAFEAAANSSDFTAILRSLQPVGRGPLRGLRAEFDQHDWAGAAPFFEQARRGHIQYGGVIGGRHRFTLTRRWLRRCLTTIARKWAHQHRSPMEHAE